MRRRRDERIEPATTILLARHGETDWNRERRFQGHADTSLNDAGRAQAEALARELGAADLAAVYTSDLRRARETAEIVARRTGADLRIERRLREIDVGEWSGLTVEEVELRFPDAFRRWRAFESHGWERGESYETLAERVVPALHAIAAEHPGRTVLLVTHGGPIRAIAGTVANVDPLAARRMIPVLANCAVTALSVTDGEIRLAGEPGKAVYSSPS